MFIFFLFHILCWFGIPDCIPARLTREEAKSWIRKEASNILKRNDLIQGKRAVKELFHTVVFVRKQKNLKELEALLRNVSDPQNIKYGKHLTKKRIAEITSNPDAVSEIKRYLHINGITKVASSLYDDYITADAPVRKWEELLKSEFYEFRHKFSSTQPFVRTLEYSVHYSLEEHVEAVLNTVQFPDLRIDASAANITQSPFHNNFEFVTPPLLQSLYHINNFTGNNLTSMGIYGNLEQSISPSDLRLFQETFHVANNSVMPSSGGHVLEEACENNIVSCMEGNLDAQYATAIAQNVPTTYYYWSGLDIWLGWITTMANMPEPPDVFSISYGSYELFMAQAYLDAFNVEAMKLGLAGTTLLVASGDDGVAGFVARSLGVQFCGYFPAFPASSPYVTAVGGTMGPENGGPEIACQTDKGGWITTGGGFSMAYPVQDWQAEAVADYADYVELAMINKPRLGYSLGKRGYPDISALANKYIIAARGQFYQISGTSASCPVVAGMVALVNAARRASGNSTLGWLNPALYSLYPSFVNDITSGDNRCLAAGAPCCGEGFYAAPGWDPVTGLGSINFDKFLSTMMGAGSSVKVAEPPPMFPWIPPTQGPSEAKISEPLPWYSTSGAATKTLDETAHRSVDWQNIFIYIAAGWLLLALVVLASVAMYKVTTRSGYSAIP